MAVVGAADASSCWRSSPFSLCSALLMAVRVANLPSYDLILRGARGMHKRELKNLGGSGGGGGAAAAAAAVGSGGVVVGWCVACPAAAGDVF